MNKKSADHNKRKMEKLVLWTLACILILVVLFVTLPAVLKRSGSETVEESVFKYKEQPMVGRKDAPVKIVEFADFKCPACKHFTEEILPHLQKEFIDSGMVQLYFINYPIVSPEADSTIAAIAGEAVYHQNPQEFWKFYKEVYARQGEEQTNWATADFFVQLAKSSKLNVDYAALKKAIEEQTFAQDVKDDKEIVRKIGIHSTPTLYINGKKLSEKDTFDYKAIKAEILKSTGENNK